MLPNIVTRDLWIKLPIDELIVVAESSKSNRRVISDPSFIRQYLHLHLPTLADKYADQVSDVRTFFNLVKSASGPRPAFRSLVLVDEWLDMRRGQLKLQKWFDQYIVSQQGDIHLSTPVDMISQIFPGLDIDEEDAEVASPVSAIAIDRFQIKVFLYKKGSKQGIFKYKNVIPTLAGKYILSDLSHVTGVIYRWMKVLGYGRISMVSPYSIVHMKDALDHIYKQINPLAYE